MKIYAAAVEALRNKGKGGQNRMKLSLPQKKGCISEFHPLLEANVLLFQVLKNLTRFWTKLRVLVPCFPDFTENSIMCLFIQHLFFPLPFSTNLQNFWSFATPMNSMTSHDYKTNVQGNDKKSIAQKNCVKEWKKTCNYQCVMYKYFNLKWKRDFVLISKLNILGSIRHNKFALKQKNTKLKHTNLKKNWIEVWGTLFLFAK